MASKPPNPNGANQYKSCTKCKAEKQLKFFELRKDSLTYRNSCKTCENNRKSGWYSSNKYTVKLQHIAQKYGLSENDYLLLVSEHNNLCAICGKVESSPDGRTKQPKSLSIDHNHETGAVRGLLCWRCNALIGYAKESIENLESAIKYLKLYGETK